MKPITIVGGGLAGLTLGVGLRQHGVPVTVWEAGRYPRHRVCGEFISGRGLESLQRLGLRDKFIQAGARIARSVSFSTTKASSPVQELPQPALCLSRHVLDHLLATEFCGGGGGLRAGERWRENGFGEGVVRATGRRVQPVAGGWRLFGLKAHARNVPMRADLEMHLSPVGYIGLCRLSGDEVNVCGLFRSRTTVTDLPQTWPDWLRGAPESPLRQLMAEAVFDPESFCSIAGLSLRPRQATAQDECCVGDAVTMIPPVTGNGMSMAFESAEIAVGLLAKFSRGEIAWPEARQRIARDCDAAFARRLRWAGWLQQGLFQPPIRAVLFLFAARNGNLWQGLFERTR